MPSKEEIEAAISGIREGFVQMECGTTGFEKALPIMAKQALTAAAKVRNERLESEEGILCQDIYGFNIQKALQIDSNNFDVFVAMRIEEISVSEWEKINKRKYLLSGDPTIGVYAVRIKWNYNYSQTLIPFSRALTKAQAEKFCAEAKAAIEAAKK